MNKKLFGSSIILIVGLGAFAVGHTSNRFENLGQKKAILTDTRILKQLGIPELQADSISGVSYAQIDSVQEGLIQKLAHDWNRCGGYEVLDNPVTLTRQFDALVQTLHTQIRKNQNFAAKSLTFDKSDRTAKAVEQINESNVKSFIQWFSSYPNRFNKDSNPNKSVLALKDRIDAILADSQNRHTWTQSAVQVTLVDHVKTRQKSIHATIKGSVHPDEIVVIGGHLDSINTFFGNSPGADDNASGSADLLEAFRVLLAQNEAPSRTIEVFWYAGEESGLLGSAEIASAYKSSNKNVVGVLQLDMTLHPGSGELVFSSMTDFTSQPLRAFLAEINRNYIGARIIDDKCGYGCSDHASWFRQGYPTVMPFEASFDDMNPKIHTANDVINAKSDFTHATAFGKLALAFAMDLAESTWTVN